MSADRVEVAEERLDERTTLLAVRGDTAALDPAFLASRLAEAAGDRIVLDLSAARRVEKGLGDVITDAGEELGRAGRHLLVVSGDPDFRQAVGLAAADEVEVAETREEALARLQP